MMSTKSRFLCSAVLLFLSLPLWNGSYMLFVSSQPGGFYRTSDFSLEIFVSFQTEDGFWTKAKNIGRVINVLSPASVSLSPDGKYIFFYSQKEKEFFWASTELIVQLK